MPFIGQPYHKKTIHQSEPSKPSNAVRDFSSPSPMTFLKIELQNILNVYNVTNDFDKTFVLAFYNSFLRLELNYMIKKMR